jgi:alkylhydroperoxidase family enzyme
MQPRMKSPVFTLPGTREALLTIVKATVWQEASRHFSEAPLGALVMTIALANLWNRLNVPTQQVTGDFIAQYI